MRKVQCWRFLDVVVKRGAVCNNDLRMLWMKMKTGKKFFRRGTKERPVKRFDVAKLQGQCEDVRGRKLPKDKFVSGMCESLKRYWNCAGTAEEKWNMMGGCDVQCG